MNRTATDLSDPTAAAAGPWTTRRLLAWTGEYLTSKGVDQPRLSAEALLAHVLGVGRIKLYMDMDRPANALERAAYRDLIERAAEHEPVDYLVGHAPFFSMTLQVSPAVLVPRPSTETLVEHVIQHSKRTPGFRSPTIADIGTGSGAIAIALAKHLPESFVVATDISEAALAVARENAKRLGVSDRIEFFHGDGLDPLDGRRVSYLLSNPPYIDDDRWARLPANVKDHEPTSALRAGADGLDVIRPLIEGASGVLEAPGQLAIEIDDQHKEAVIALVNTTDGLDRPRVLADHEGLDRVLVADRVE